MQDGDDVVVPVAVTEVARAAGAAAAAAEGNAHTTTSKRQRTGGLAEDAVEEEEQENQQGSDEQELGGQGSAEDEDAYASEDEEDDASEDEGSEEEEEAADPGADLSDEEGPGDDALEEARRAHQPGSWVTGGACSACPAGGAGLDGGGAAAGQGAMDVDGDAAAAAAAAAEVVWHVEALEHLPAETLSGMGTAADQADAVATALLDATNKLRDACENVHGMVPPERWACCKRGCCATLHAQQMENTAEMSAQALTFKEKENSRPRAAVIRGSLFIRSIKAKRRGRRGDSTNAVRPRRNPPPVHSQDRDLDD